VVDLLHQLAWHCVRILEVDAAGLVLSTQRAREDLQVLASSTERTRLLELFQLQNDEGPCLDCVRTGEPVLVPDLRLVTERWPRFAPQALREGFIRVHAVPLRLRGETIGALNLFGHASGVLPERDLLVARALADTATIGILQERAIRRGEVLTEQLESGPAQPRRHRAGQRRARPGRQPGHGTGLPGTAGLRPPPARPAQRHRPSDRGRHHRPDEILLPSRPSTA
jgi:hypothetical protein